MSVLLIVILCLKLASSQILSFNEGDECRPLQGGLGICKNLLQCKTAGDFKKTKPPICTFDGIVPVICCPVVVTTRVKPGYKAQQYCKYLDARCKDDLTITKNIVGGFASVPKTHNYMVSIGYGNQDNISWNCRGTLITSSYVMSVAHCAEAFNLGPAKWARLGDLDLSIDNEDARPVDMRIVNRIIHPDYVVSEMYNDIVIFELDSDVPFSLWVKPICLNTKKVVDQRRATVIGWGRIGFAEATSPNLLEANIDIYNDTECFLTVFNKVQRASPRGYDSDIMFCAGVPDGSKEACLGDSGGPLVVRETGRCVQTQIGITSYGNKCGLRNDPNVYTRVSNYIAWIESIVFSDVPDFI